MTKPGMTPQNRSGNEDSGSEMAQKNYLTSVSMVGPTGFEPVTNPECFRGCSKRRAGCAGSEGETAQVWDFSCVSFRVPMPGHLPASPIPASRPIPKVGRGGVSNEYDLADVA